MIYLNVAIHVKVFARVTQAAVLNQGSASVNCLMEKQTKTKTFETRIFVLWGPSFMFCLGPLIALRRLLKLYFDGSECGVFDL